MKTCLLCGEAAADDAETCQNDGEASWAGDRAPATAVVDGGEAAADDAPKPSRRGRR